MLVSQEDSKKDRDEEKKKEREEKEKRKREQCNYMGDGDGGGGSGDGGNKLKYKCLIQISTNHLTRKCFAFKSKTVDDRAQLVKDLGACSLCLTITHIGNRCPRITSGNAVNPDALRNIPDFSTALRLLVW